MGFFIQKENWYLNIEFNRVRINCRTILGNCIPFQLNIFIDWIDEESVVSTNIRLFDYTLTREQMENLFHQLIECVPESDIVSFETNQWDIDYTNASPSMMNELLVTIVGLMAQYSPEDSFEIPNIVYEKHLTSKSSTLYNAIRISESIETLLSSAQCTEIKFSVSKSNDELFYIVHGSCEFICDIDQIGAKHFYHHRNENYQYQLKSFNISEFIRKMQVVPSEDPRFEQINDIISYVIDNREEFGGSWSLAIHQEYVFISNQCDSDKFVSKIFSFMFKLTPDKDTSIVQILMN